MKITFGMYQDGACWSDKGASSGEVRIGPLGLVSLLETRLGLAGPSVHPAVRIDQYMHRMEMKDGPGKWFYDSFQADAWSTARQMLAWRDELVEGGWSGESDETMSPRLKALSELERIDLPLAMGYGDRLREVLEQLKEVTSISIDVIYLREDFDLLPPAYKKLFNGLRDKAVRIETAPESKSLSQSSVSNLSSVQTILRGESQPGSVKDNDDSLLLIRSSDEWEAAEILARWLAAGEKDNKETAIICGSDTAILDQALEQHGLPKLVGSESSPWRASLQVLPLVLANAWRPVNVYRLVELLSLPLAPVPGFAARHLLRALSNEPGVRGNAWNEALSKISDEYETKGNRKKAAAEFVAGLEAMLATDRYLPEEGIPGEKLIERCQWVVEGLAWRAEKEPFLVEAVSHCREMQKLAGGKGLIPRITAERMLDSVIGIGAPAPDRFEQAAPWQVVRHPGQITRPCQTIIWWDFVDPMIGSSGYWSRTEREDLLKFGIELEDSRLYRQREARAWERGFLQAGKHFLMFYPRNKCGEAVYHHPFWDEILNGAIKAAPKLAEDDLKACLIREGRDLQANGLFKLAGRRMNLEKVEIRPAPVMTDTFTILPDRIGRPASNSYSRMNTMIACPLKWVLEHHAGLTLPDTQAVPSGNLMIGNLCHRIVQELYIDPARSWTPDQAETRAGELYDGLVESMASELLLEGNELDRMRYRRSIMTAVRELVSAVNRLKLTVEASEQRLEGDLDGIQFAGYADLLLRDSQGNPFILDMKWSSSSRYRREEIEQGEALQLAAYSWLLKTAHPESPVHSAYFMLAQGELLSDSHLLQDEALSSAYNPHPLPSRFRDQDEALSSAYNPDEIWAMGVRSWNKCLVTLNNGQVEAGGLKVRCINELEGIKEEKVMERLKSLCEAEGRLYQKPVCGFCDFTVLCGLKGADS